MKCPFCHHPETRVIDSRTLEEGTIIRRRRECLKCKSRFTTHEDLELLNLTVIKRDGRKESYDREKIIQGIKKACEKRPVSQEDILHLVSCVEQELHNINSEEVESRKIGDLVIDHLKNLDKVAYLRFASVYKNFRGIDGFRQEIEKLKELKEK